MATTVGSAIMKTSPQRPSTHREFSFSTIQEGSAMPKCIAPGPSGLPQRSKFLLASSSVRARYAVDGRSYWIVRLGYIRLGLHIKVFKVANTTLSTAYIQSLSHSLMINIKSRIYLDKVNQGCVTAMTDCSSPLFSLINLRSSPVGLSGWYMRDCLRYAFLMSAKDELWENTFESVKGNYLLVRG